jgi:hypothetical protein
MDPETGATVKDVYDRVTSPKRDGVRFVDSSSAGRARRDLTNPDTRTPAQLASDGFLELLRLGAGHDPKVMLGTGAPIVTIVTTIDTVTTRQGAGYFEGQADAVSVGTIERFTCTGVTRDITVNSAGQPLDLGRDQRLFTRAQKQALAVRDGGCLMPDCDRPPSWAEAHHINHWERDHGETNVKDGVLLCRHHHLLVHNNGWEIRRDNNDTYWLTAPRDAGHGPEPIPLVSKSPVIRGLYPPADERCG